eukprot:1120730-Rhodomonas_salina.1
MAYRGTVLDIACQYRTSHRALVGAYRAPSYHSPPPLRLPPVEELRARCHYSCQYHAVGRDTLGEYGTARRM